MVGLQPVPRWWTTSGPHNSSTTAWFTSATSTAVPWIDLMALSSRGPVPCFSSRSSSATSPYEAFVNKAVSLCRPVLWSFNEKTFHQLRKDWMGQDRPGRLGPVFLFSTYRKLRWDELSKLFLLTWAHAHCEQCLGFFVLQEPDLTWDGFTVSMRP